jgi:isopentenyl diphosphate isomerase/L-lactate dehydrogenase-like FMN-dependent dehydrogenase
LTDASESEFLALHEIVRAARGRLDDKIWDYLAGGSETETTLLRNRLALDSCALRPRVLRDISNINMKADFFGREVPLPVVLAPVGSLESFWENGGPALARAAASFGLPLFVSSVMKDGLETMAAASSGPRVFQLYARGDDAWLDEQVERVIAHGYDAFCLTVDNAVTSRRERDITKRFEKPWRKWAKGTEFQTTFTWKGVDRLKRNHPGIPFIIKGIGTAEDAEEACQVGVDVVYVSNHGGRQLDQGAGTFDVLPEVVEAVAGRAKVFVDGGYYRGTDIVKALAMGADFVGIGRLYLYGLAAGGEAGVLRALSLLRDEIEIAMALLGLANRKDLNASYVRADRPVRNPHLLSAFPLLEQEAR